MSKAEVLNLDGVLFSTRAGLCHMFRGQRKSGEAPLEMSGQR